MIDVTAEDEHLLKVPSAARLLCMSEKTLRELIEKGDIPFVMLGKSVRIPKTMLNDYLNVQLQKEQKEDKND